MTTPRNLLDLAMDREDDQLTGLIEHLGANDAANLILSDTSKARSATLKSFHLESHLRC